MSAVPRPALRLGLAGLLPLLLGARRAITFAVFVLCRPPAAAAHRARPRGACRVHRLSAAPCAGPGVKPALERA